MATFGELLDGIVVESSDILLQYQHLQIDHITADSRNVPSNGNIIFFALNGVHVDGHAFIKDVVKKNPNTIIISEHSVDTKCLLSIRVDDINDAMAKVARRYFQCPDGSMEIIAITGTNGKTTTSYLCHAMLGALWKTAVIGTIAYRIGDEVRDAPNTTPVAIDLFNILSDAKKQQCSIAVLEISSHGLTQKRALGLSVDVAVFTNLTQDHLDYHHDMEQYFDAKKMLFDGRNGIVPKHAVINIDDVYGDRLYEMVRSTIHSISFGFSEYADARIVVTTYNSISGVSFELHYNNSVYCLSSSLIGKHNIYNIAGAFLASLCLHNEPDVFCQALVGVHVVSGRLEKIPLCNGACAFVDFAHTPDGLRVVLEALNELKHHDGRLIVVFGCGGCRDRSKRAPMTSVVDKYADIAIVTSDNPRDEQIESIFDDMRPGITNVEKFSFVNDRKDAIRQALKMSRAHDIILIAGKGHEQYQIIGNKKYHYSDCETVKFLNEEIDDVSLS